MLSRYKHYLNFLICLLCIAHFCSGQDLEDLDEDYSEIWADLTLSKSLNEKWTIGGDIGYRAALNNTNWRQYYIRPNINYKVLPFFNLTMGVGSFNTVNDEIDNTNEFRIYQDGNFRGPKLGPFNILHRIRLEQRFFSFGDDTLDNEFSFRGRYLIGTRTDKFSLGGEKDWTAYVSLEPFFPLGKDISELLANNFRWDAALSYHVTAQFRIELHYILQTSEIFSNSDVKVIENIFRIRLFQKL